MSTDSPAIPRLLPPHYLALSVAAIVALHLGTHSAVLLPGYWRFSGSVPLLLGLWIAVRGSRLFSEVETNIIPFSKSSTLVTQDVFSWSRNPMYLGMILFLAGLCLLLNSAWPWGIVVAFTFLLRFAFIAREEILMQQTFGQAYSDYCSTTPRWLRLSGSFQHAAKANK